MKRALLIGIRNVPNIPRAFGRPLLAPHNDVERLAAILSEKYAFDDIRVLIDRIDGPPEGEGSESCSCRFCSAGVRHDDLTLHDDLPTRDGIRRAVGELIEATKENDITAIYYSGHGSEFIGSGLLAGKRFQTIVPHDSGRGHAPNRDIFDTEIDLWLQRLNEKTPYVTFIFDSCHSGGVTDGRRSGRRPMPRRRIGAERRTPETALSSGDLSELQRTLDPFEQPGQSSSTRGWLNAPNRGPSGWLQGSRSAVLLAACRANQLAVETKSEGKQYGKFTHELARALESTEETRWSKLFATLLQPFETKTQKPQREGDGPIFAPGELDPRDQYPPKIVRLKKLAVVIGIDYKAAGARGGFAPLETPASDAVKVAEALRDEQGYEIVGLGGKKPLLNEQATRKNIHLLLDKLGGRLRQYDGDTAVVVYFAGHGEVDPDDRGGFRGYLIPWDAERRERSTWLPMRDLRDHMKDGIRDSETLARIGIGAESDKKELRALESRHLLLVLDCCFAGAMSVDWFLRGRMPDRPIYYSEYKRFVEGSAWQLLTSATMSQLARDVDPRAGEGAHSPFAGAFIDGLRTESADGFRVGSQSDRIITATELHQYIDDRLRRLEPSKATVQTPSLMDLKPGEGEYIFTVPGWTPKPAIDPPLETGKNPWWGGRAYEAGVDEDPLFFGRQRATLHVTQKILDGTGPVLAVVGPSGAGKSSVVRAGVVPLLKNPVEGRRRVRTWLNQIGWERFLIAPEEIAPLETWARTEGLDELLRTPRDLARRIRALVARARAEGLLDDKAPDTTHVQLAQAQAERIGADVFFEQTARQKRLRLARRLRFLDLLDDPTELAYEIELWLKGLPQLLNATPEELEATVGVWNVMPVRVEKGRDMVEALETKAAEIRDARPGKRHLLFIDGFEKLLVPSAGDPDALVRAIRACRDSLFHVKGQLLVTLRSDALVRDDRRARLDELLEKREEFELAAPRHTALREVIERPAAAMALSFEPRQIVDEILESVRDRPSPLALLSTSLATMYEAVSERRSAGRNPLDRRLIRDDWRKPGGTSGYLTQALTELDEAYGERAEHRRFLSTLWSRFVPDEDDDSPSRVVGWQELVFDTPEEQESVDEVVEDLVARHLVVSGQNGIQLAAPELLEWRGSSPTVDGVSAIRGLWQDACAWHESARDTQRLWFDASKLAPLVKLESESHVLNRMERHFLDACVKARRESAARQLAREATRLASLDWSRGALLASEAAAWTDSTETLQALLDVLDQTPLSIPFQLPGPVYGMKFTDGDRTLRVATRVRDGAKLAWVLDVETLDWAFEDGGVPDGAGRLRDPESSSALETRRPPVIDVPESSLGTLRVPGHAAEPQFYAFGRSGHWFASGLVLADERSSEIRVWRMSPLEDQASAPDVLPTEMFPGEPRVLRGEVGGDGFLEHVSFTQEDAVVAVRRSEPPLIWDLKSTWPVAERLASRDGVWSYAESPPSVDVSPHLWTGVSSGTAFRIQDQTQSGRAVLELEAPGGDVKLRALCTDARVIIASRGDSKTLVWDRRVREGAMVELDAWWQTLSLASDGAMFAAQRAGSDIELWDTSNVTKPLTTLSLGVPKKPTARFRGARDRHAAHLAMDPRGRWLLALHHGRTFLWTLPDGKRVEPNFPRGIPSHRAIVTRASFASDGSCLCLGTLDGDVLRVDLTSSPLDATLVPHGVKGSVESVSFGRANSLAVGADGVVHLWRSMNGKDYREPPLVLTGERRRDFSVRQVRFSDDGTRLAMLLHSERAAYADRVVVFRLDRDELVQLLWANAGRDLTEYERARYLPDEDELGAPPSRDAAFRREARAVHRSTILGR